MDNNRKLETYVEQISDDFQSTFTVVAENTLANMLDPADFENLTNIVRNYIPDVGLEFIKTNSFSTESYDIYLVKLWRAKDEKN